MCVTCQAGGALHAPPPCHHVGVTAHGVAHRPADVCGGGLECRVCVCVRACVLVSVGKGQGAEWCGEVSLARLTGGMCTR